jgi:RNA recognition motif-containing protein
MNIFVGNLSEEFSEYSLSALFQEFGLVRSVKVVKDSYGGIFKVFGFVEMFSESDAINAIKRLNNKPFFGKRIMVNKREV